MKFSKGTVGNNGESRVGKRARLFLMLAFILGSTTVFAKANVINRCESLNSELKAMQDAQKVLLQNLVGTNDNMASTLDHYAEDLKSDQASNRPASAIEVIDLKRNAESFREHKIREQKLVAKFELKSRELLNKVESCLRR